MYTQAGSAVRWRSRGRRGPGLLTQSAAEGLGQRERPLGLGRALHAVAQRAYALLPVPGEASPSNLPHGRVAQVGDVGAHRRDGCRKKRLSIDIICIVKHMAS